LEFELDASSLDVELERCDGWEDVEILEGVVNDSLIRSGYME